ncbi:MAG: hypothetical protein WD007_05385 [Nitriliruptoraceae bacterium]
MRLAFGSADLPPSDVFSDALSHAVVARGHAPAVTVIDHDGRHEQGMVSLAQWASKGAHLLTGTLGLPPGALVAIDLAPSWTSAAVCMAAWWSGLGVSIVTDGIVPQHAGVVVCAENDATDVSPTTGQASHSPADTPPQHRFWVGTSRDGIPQLSGLVGWTDEVQWLPDAPPPPRDVEGVALSCGSRTWTMADLLAEARSWQAGTVGIEVGATELVAAIVAVAVRPVVSGHPTVVVDGVPRARADGDRIAYWR